MTEQSSQLARYWIVREEIKLTGDMQGEIKTMHVCEFTTECNTSTHINIITR